MSFLLLASRSPRRRALLKAAGLPFRCITPPDIDESPKPNELPRDYVRRMAVEKMHAISLNQGYTLTADTSVAVGRRILGKPNNSEDAERMLLLLSGRRHRVYGTLCLRIPSGILHLRQSLSVVQFKPLSYQERITYLREREWKDAAGAYKIQGKASKFVRQIRGSYSNIVGLDVHQLHLLLEGQAFLPLKISD